MWPPRRNPPPLLMPRPTLKRRAARAAGRGTWKATRATVRGGVRHRRRLTPIYAAVLLLCVATVLHEMPRGAANNAVAIDALAAAVLIWWQVRAHRRGRLIYRSPGRFKRWPAAAWVWRRRKVVWQSSLLASAQMWLLASAWVAPWVPPMPGVLAVWALAAGIPWWWHHRIRRTPEQATATPVVDERHELWAEYIGAPGTLAPGATLGPITELLDPEPEREPADVIGWTAQVEVHRGKTITPLTSQIEALAGVFDRAVADTSIEPLAGGSTRLGALTIYVDNPLRRIRDWPGQHLYDPVTGIAKIAFYADGTAALYRMFRPGSGPTHDLIAGTTEAGKSRLVDQLLAYERAAGYASVILDPQMGQSLPAWRNHVALYARGTDECVAALIAIRQELDNRNRDLSEVVWEDEDGFEQVGVDSFDPNHPAVIKLGLRMLCITVEEAAQLTRIPAALAILEDIATMARKCGIKLRLIVQVPLLEQLGSTTLRDMVAGGNVIVFRTANRLSGQVAFNGNLPADPVTLPKEWPDRSTTSGLCYVSGPSARPMPARTWFVRHASRVARAGETTRLPMLVAMFQTVLAAGHGADHETAMNTGAAALVNEHSAQTAEQAAAETSGVGTVAARITHYLAEHDTGIATTGTLSAALSAPLNTISTTCRRMVQRGELVDHGRGMWGRPGVRLPEQELAEVAA